MLRRNWPWALLLGPPVLLLALWLASGREVLTKTTRFVDVVEIDAFGEANPVKREVHGPILGYYVGIDLVLVIGGPAAAAGLAGLWYVRRRARKVGHANPLSAS